MVRQFFIMQKKKLQNSFNDKEEEKPGYKHEESLFTVSGMIAIFG